MGDHRAPGGRVRARRRVGTRVADKTVATLTQTVDASERRAVHRSRRDCERLDDSSLAEIEVAWSDPFGHAQGKRIPAAQFLNRARGTGFAFCEASLGWNTDGTVIDSLRLTNWEGGYPDVYAVPDLSTFQLVPWRARGPRHRGYRCPRPQSVIARSAGGAKAGAGPARRLGYTAKVGVELEFYLLNPDGSPFQHDIHAYSLENANALDPLITDLYETLGAFTDWRVSRPSTAPARSRPTWSLPMRWRPPTTPPG